NCAGIRCCPDGFYQSENHRPRPDAEHSVFLLKCQQKLLQSGCGKYGQISPPRYSPHPAQSGIQLFHATMKYAVGHHNPESIQAVAARKSSLQILNPVLQPPVAADGSSPDGLNARRQNYRWSRQFWVIQNERLKHLDGAAAWANQVLRNIGRLYIAIISRFRLAVVFLCNIFLENSSSLALSSFVFIPIDHV